MRAYSLVVSGLQASIKTPSSTILSYTDATVASSTGTNGQSLRHWTQQECSPQAAEILLHRRSLDITDILPKDLPAAILSSLVLTQISNHCFLQRSSLVLDKAHTTCPVTPHQNFRRSICQESRIMGECQATTDIGKHPSIGRILDKCRYLILDVV